MRGRIKRGTIGYERDGERVYVYLDAGRTATGRNQGDDQTTDRPELIELLRAQVEDLRAERDAWREQARRSDYLHGLSVERTRELEGRLRELEAGADPRPGEAETSEAQESPEGTGPTRTPTNPAGGPEAAAQSRPWWKRILGGER